MSLTLLAALLAPGLFQEPKITWGSLKEEVPGQWSAKASYPQLAEDTPLNRHFNDSMLASCFFQVRSASARKVNVTVKGILSVVTPNYVGGLVSTERQGEPVRLEAVSCWQSAGQPLRAVWGHVVKPGTEPADFAQQVLLPVLNSMRVKAGLTVLESFPPGLLDQFVQTKANVSWVTPPGLAGRDAEQIKVPISVMQPWLDPNGALGHLVAKPAGLKIPVGVLLRWQARDGLPAGAVVQVTVSRERDAASPLAKRSFLAQDPPMDLKFEFENVAAEAGERLFLEFRIVANNENLFRNREPVKIPVEGWQTVHEIRLDRER